MEMKQFFRESVCFIAGHDWTEYSTKALDNYIYYKDRKCGCCGKVEILKNDYAWRIEYLEKYGSKHE